MPKSQAQFNWSTVHRGSQLRSSFTWFLFPVRSCAFESGFPPGRWVGWERCLSSLNPFCYGSHSQTTGTYHSLLGEPLSCTKPASLLKTFNLSWFPSYSDFCQSHFLENHDQVYWNQQRLTVVPKLSLLSSFFIVSSIAKANWTHLHTTVNTHTFLWRVTTDHRGPQHQGPLKP